MLKLVYWTDADEFTGEVDLESKTLTIQVNITECVNQEAVDILLSELEAEYDSFSYRVIDS